MPDSRTSSGASGAGAQRPPIRTNLPRPGANVQTLPLFLTIGTVQYRLSEDDRQPGDEASRLVRLTSGDDEVVVGVSDSGHDCSCDEFHDAGRFDCRHIGALVKAGCIRRTFWPGGRMVLAGEGGASWR